MHIIGGTLRKRILKTPAGKQVRPTSGALRETLFNILQQQVEGTHVLDLFAGSGAIGIEAVSRGAAHATFVDSSNQSIRCIRSNITTCNIKSTTRVISGDVFRVLQRLQQRNRTFDIIFADPPYQATAHDHPEAPTYSQQLLGILDSSTLLAAGGLLFIEEASNVTLHTDHLQHLAFIKSRRFGNSSLHQFEAALLA